MCQGLVLVYSCRHRQVGEVHICDAARRSASTASCMASFTYMLTGREPKRSCGDVKTSRRYLLEPCLACHIQADLHGEPVLSQAQAYANMGPSSSNPTSSVRRVSPPAETGSFRSDPSKYITRPYVGDLMSTATTAATSVAVAVAMPKSVVVASSRGRAGSRSSSAGPSSSSRPQSRGRSRTTSTTTTSSFSNNSRSRSTSRGRASAAVSAHNLPGSRKTGRRSQSAARRFATADRLSTVAEDSIPMVPMNPQGPASGHSVGRPVGKSFSSSSSSSSSSRLAPPPPVRRSDGPSRSTMAASSSSSSSSYSSRSKGKGKEVVKDLPKLPTSSSTSSYKGKGKAPSYTQPSSSSSKASKAKPRSPKAGSSSPPTAPKTGSPPRSISNRLLASKKVAKSEESLVCADSARIEGKGNFF